MIVLWRLLRIFANENINPLKHIIMTSTPINNTQEALNVMAKTIIRRVIESIDSMVRILKTQRNISPLCACAAELYEHIGTLVLLCSNYNDGLNENEISLLEGDINDIKDAITQEMENLINVSKKHS